MVPNWTSKYVAHRDHVRDLRSDQQGDKVFDNLYMLWMCIWMYHHHVMAVHADQALWNFATNLGKSQMICDLKSGD